MMIMKRIKYSSMIFLVTIFLFSACGKTEPADTKLDSNSPLPATPTPAFVTEDPYAYQSLRYVQDGDVEWDTDMSVKEKTSLGTCYAYVSVDGQYAWIYKYKLNKEKDITHIEIPDTIKDMKVRRIGSYYGIDDGEFSRNIFDVVLYDGGFSYVDSKKVKWLERIEHITIPDGVEKIMPDAFMCLSRLKRIDFPRDLKTIGESAFGRSYENLEEITLPDENEHFILSNGILIKKKNMELEFVISGKTDVVIPNGVEEISDFYMKKNVKRITIPASVTKLRQGIFSDMEEIVISEDNPVYAYNGTCVYEKETGKLVTYVIEDQTVTIPAEVTELCQDVFDSETPFDLVVEEANPVYAHNGTCVFEKETGLLLAVTIKDNKLIIEEGVKRIAANQYHTIIGDPGTVKKIICAKSLYRKDDFWIPEECKKNEVEVIFKRKSMQEE